LEEGAERGGLANEDVTCVPVWRTEREEKRERATLDSWTGPRRGPISNTAQALENDGNCPEESVPAAP